MFFIKSIFSLSLFIFSFSLYSNNCEDLIFSINNELAFYPITKYLSPEEASLFNNSLKKVNVDYSDLDGIPKTDFEMLSKYLSEKHSFLKNFNDLMLTMDETVFFIDFFVYNFFKEGSDARNIIIKSFDKPYFLKNVIAEFRKYPKTDKSVENVSGRLLRDYLRFFEEVKQEEQLGKDVKEIERSKKINKSRDIIFNNLKFNNDEIILLKLIEDKITNLDNFALLTKLKRLFPVFLLNDTSKGYVNRRLIFIIQLINYNQKEDLSEYYNFIQKMGLSKNNNLIQGMISLFKPVDTVKMENYYKELEDKYRLEKTKYVQDNFPDLDMKYQEILIRVLIECPETRLTDHFEISLNSISILRKYLNNIIYSDLEKKIERSDSDIYNAFRLVISFRHGAGDIFSRLKRVNDRVNKLKYKTDEESFLYMLTTR